ncbi:MAG: response regulator [Bdellovibrionales bacterium CG12_big_fil_rev_8_21_14_0_65_38_15]|nr:MAG: response regulator [Bdellovibrionales bacterium CG22_combo_CG10-13_8_21_14_all_38_13]PIQ56834.1 MAG: response regulator [Bdellovibrionales bacterium CG12_big_fil_rev_8_21_14_0_65_38_15]PIR29755.1 MAG: response regulator [Bdellovibrionales bacterium CG11_big_fil_rev_8_21_14_0_20_38_13]
MPLKASMHILVIDTNSTMRQNVKKLLSDIGFKNIKEAASGKKALEVLEESSVTQQPIEFIISELELEKMTAIELLSTIRKDPKNAKTKFLLMTGDSDQQKMMQAIRAGVNNVVVKPFSADMLKEKIAKIYGQ